MTMSQEETDFAGAEDPAATAHPPELVGRFADRESFTAAVTALKAAGFQPADLSVLDTHESLSASERPSEAWKESLAGMVGEIKYIGPLTAAGLIAIATGPVGAAISGLMAAGITGAALHEFLTDLRATPHTEAFARALERGAVLLWVAVPTDEREQAAQEILQANGAEDIHLHSRTPAT